MTEARLAALGARAHHYRGQGLARLPFPRLIIRFHSAMPRPHSGGGGDEGRDTSAERWRCTTDRGDWAHRSRPLENVEHSARN